MKTLVLSICLIVWMLLTITLVCSIVGLILFIPKDTYICQDNTPSTWMHIGRTLLDSIIKK
jgi:hypothetical protein